MDEDYELALQISQQLNSNADNVRATTEYKSYIEKPLSIIDESWETIDPVPNIHELFIQFNQAYFYGQLAGCEVKWSNRMTLCAGVCCYEGRGGLCSIKLSEPLLKLRPRSDLVNTLLHEMIHALLFVTDNNKDHDGHGPEFHKHMYRINKETGSKITVYHTFHDEVNNYRQHWWKCDGPCVKRPPYYGIVRRAMNRAPSSRDPWFNAHKQNCGGSFRKIKEPEKTVKTKKTKDEKKDVNKKTTNQKKGNSKEITDWLSKPTTEKNNTNKQQNGNLNSANTKLNSQHSDTLKNTSFWKNNTVKDNVNGFGVSTKSDATVFSRSSENASSNIHGFKMSENTEAEQKQISTFSGKGFKISSSSSTVSSREAFLKRLETNMTSSKSILAQKRNHESTSDLNSSSSTSKTFLNDKEDSININKKSKKNKTSFPVDTGDQRCLIDIIRTPSRSSRSGNNTVSTKPTSSSINAFVEPASSRQDDQIDDMIMNMSAEEACGSASNPVLLLEDSFNTDERSSTKSRVVLVDCPACPAKVAEHELNQHLDTCLL